MYMYAPGKGGGGFSDNYIIDPLVLIEGVWEYMLL